MQNVIAVDVGGTKMLSGRFASSDISEPEETFRILTDAGAGQDVVLQNLLSAISAVRTTDTIAIGLSWAGLIDSQKGSIQTSPNISGFEDFEICSFLSQETGLPVKIQNDAQLFALAEQHILPDSPSPFLGIICGTGVGAGLIYDGNIFRGSQNIAGEIGHQILFDSISQEYVSAENLFSATAVKKMLGYSLFEIERRWEKDSVFQEHIHQEMSPRIHQMSDWIYNLILHSNPEKIVFGGGAGIHFWSLFLSEISENIHKKREGTNLPIHCEISQAQLQNAGLVGAAILAREKWGSGVA